MRVFAAVNLPPALRQAIHTAATPLRNAGLPVKWVDVDGIHLTLKFLGEVAPDRVPAIVEALERACVGVRAFPLGVGGFGAFPSVDRARVIWIGCESAPPLELLQHGVEREYGTLGFPIEGRPFRPHLTLGRARQQARAGVHGLAALVAEPVFEDTWTVETVDLMESTLTPAGARHTIRHRVPLA